MTAYEESQATLITGLNMQEYFNNSVHSALAHQKVEAMEETVYYIVNLLAYFTRADSLFTQTTEGMELQPLALLYAEALEAPGVAERQLLLRRLGDVALMIAGLFPSSLHRKVVDVDYYIAMGGAAYGFLGEMDKGTVRGRVFCAIFDELSRKFQVFVDVLAEVGENSHLSSGGDILRLYDLWVKTGSKRVSDKLRKLGIEPARASTSRRLN